MVVEVARAFHHTKASRQNLRQYLLSRGLSGRSGHCQQGLAPESPRRRAQGLQCGQRVIDKEQPRRIGFHFSACLYYRCHSTLLQCGGNVIMAVVAFTFDGDEQVTGAERARVNRVPHGDQLLVHVSFGGGKLDDSPQRQLHRFSPVSCSWPISCKISTATWTSSNRKAPARVVWVFSWPLPAIRTISPVLASASAMPIAFLRSGSTMYRTPLCCRPGRESRMIAMGSSLRGLSDVRTTKSLPCPAALPIRERLVRSRSPPQPKTVITRPFASVRDTKSRALEVRLLSALSACA